MEFKQKIFRGRQLKFDYLRIIAIILVVICHSVAVIYPYLDTTNMSAQRFLQLSEANQLFSSIMVVVGRLGVPFFFMLSGYFLINKLDLSVDGINKFYKSRFLKLLVTFEIWMVIYEVFVRLFLHLRVGLIQILLELLFVSKVPANPRILSNTMWQIWFIPAILGIYLAIPLLAIFIKSVPTNVQAILIVVAVMFNFLIPTMNTIFQVLGKNVILSSSIDHGFIGTSFGIYVVIGGMIKRGWLKQFSQWLLVMTGILSFLLALIIQIVANHVLAHTYFVWYDNIFILVTAVVIFEFVRRIKNQPSKWAQYTIALSQFSLGVYLIHRPIQIMIQKYLFWTNSEIVNFFINLFATYLLSLLLVYLLSRSKLLKTYLFYGR